MTRKLPILSLLLARTFQLIPWCSTYQAPKTMPQTTQRARLPSKTSLGATDHLEPTFKGSWSKTMECLERALTSCLTLCRWRTPSSSQPRSSRESKSPWISSLDERTRESESMIRSMLILSLIRSFREELLTILYSLLERIIRIGISQWRSSPEFLKFLKLVSLILFYLFFSACWDRPRLLL